MIASRKSETSRLVAGRQTAARSIVVDPETRTTFTEPLSWWAPTEFAGTRATPRPEATIANWLLILIGGMVIVFNYLPFRLEAAPYRLAPTMVSLIFLTYLGGTAGSRVAGWLKDRVGGAPILAAAGLLMAGGAALTLARPVSMILLGLVVLTTGLFIGHAVASTLVAVRANHGRAQATAMYNISYYAGSSAFGWLGGIAWLHAQWLAVTALVVMLGLGASVLGLRPARRVTLV